MDTTDTGMKRTMSYLFIGLFSLFFSIIYLVNVIVY
jgi:hypothetical protein